MAEKRTTDSFGKEKHDCEIENIVELFTTSELDCCTEDNEGTSFNKLKLPGIVEEGKRFLSSSINVDVSRRTTLGKFFRNLNLESRREVPKICYSEVEAVPLVIYNRSENVGKKQDQHETSEDKNNFVASTMHENELLCSEDKEINSGRIKQWKDIDALVEKKCTSSLNLSLLDNATVNLCGAEAAPQERKTQSIGVGESTNELSTTSFFIPGKITQRKNNFTGFNGRLHESSSSVLVGSNALYSNPCSRGNSCLIDSFKPIAERSESQENVTFATQQNGNSFLDIVYVIDTDKMKKSEIENKGETTKRRKATFDSQYSDIDSLFRERYPNSLSNCFHSQTNRVFLNICGKTYETFEDTLAKYPDTLLGDPDKRMKYYNRQNGQFVFMRNIDCFDAILFYYQSNGILSKPLGVNSKTFESELDFFEISDDKKKFSTRHWNESSRDLRRRKTSSKLLPSILKRPFSNTISSVIAYITILITLISAIEFCIETSKPYRAQSKFSENGKMKSLQKNQSLRIIEAACMGFFTIDFLLRMYIEPKRFQFICSSLGLVDVISLWFFYISLLMSYIKLPVDVATLFLLLGKLRILQVFRLARYSYGFRALLKTVSKSLSQLASFIFVIPVMGMFFASVTFFVEGSAGHDEQEYCKEGCKKFGSLSDWFWYSVITMTTVGYGDVYPRTILGKFIGSSCALFGVILFCLLTPIIFRQFVENYYVRGVLSHNITDERRKLAEKVTEMYYEQYDS